MVWEHRHQLIKTTDLGTVERIRGDPDAVLSTWRMGQVLEKVKKRILEGRIRRSLKVVQIMVPYCIRDLLI